MSSADENLKQAYSAALGRLSPEGRQVLGGSQVSWLRYVDASCPMTTDPAKRAQVITCVLREYGDRGRDLELAAVQKGPFLFSRVDDYSVSLLSRRSGEYDTGLARHHVAYPRIDAPKTRQTTLWNALVVRKDEPSACDSGDGDTRTDYSLDVVTANLIGITWTSSDYCHGAPHGFGGSQTQTLLLSPEPHPVIPSDLFRSNAPWKDRLATLLLAGVRQAARDKRVTFDEGHAEHVAEVARDPRRWSLDADGLGSSSTHMNLGRTFFFRTSSSLGGIFVP